MSDASVMETERAVERLLQRELGARSQVRADGERRVRVLNRTALRGLVEAAVEEALRQQATRLEAAVDQRVEREVAAIVEKERVHLRARMSDLNAKEEELAAREAALARREERLARREAELEEASRASESERTSRTEASSDEVLSSKAVREVVSSCSGIEEVRSELATIIRLGRKSVREQRVLSEERDGLQGEVHRLREQLRRMRAAFERRYDRVPDFATLCRSRPVESLAEEEEVPSLAAHLKAFEARLAKKIEAIAERVESSGGGPTRRRSRPEPKPERAPAAALSKEKRGILQKLVQDNIAFQKDFLKKKAS